MAVTYEVRTITPDEARELLAHHNPHNRPMKEAAIARYMADLREGNWRLNGEAVKLDADGNLIDGQNRCEASARSGIPITTLVVSGLDPSTQTTMDQGVRRSPGDTVRLATGEKYSTGAAAIARADWRWERDGPMATFRAARRTNATMTQMLGHLAAHPDIPHAAEIGQRVSNSLTGLLAPSLAGVLYLRLSRISRADADAFFDAMATGSGLEAGSPMLTLRNRLMSEGKGGAKLAKAALVVKAWNAYRKGRSIKRLSWKSEDGFPEAI